MEREPVKAVLETDSSKKFIAADALTADFEQNIDSLSSAFTRYGTKLRRRALRDDLSVLRKIGSGLQYTVYDLGNGRVFKRPATFLESYVRIFAWRFPFRKTSIWDVTREIRQKRARAALSLEWVRPLLPRISRELGNPVLYADLSYEQDRAVVVNDYLRNHTLAENKELVDRYVATLLRFWEHGFNDRTCSFCLNFGVDETGAVILLDLGELYFEKDTARQRVRLGHWRDVHIDDDVLNAYYRGAMKTAMTEANVEMYWGRAL
ncbi:MAG: hypothetical protein KGJ79_06575 [Alphaproteobacteria bacterium]|nr:hypothetical protein [Alphaproteobacteria bacterium]MDE2110788.1 hypothetical protein [Alphaproteobacteria bacterium]